MYNYSYGMKIYVKSIKSKKISLTPGMKEEINELKKIRHPNLIQFVGIYYDLNEIKIATGNKLNYHNNNNKINKN